MSADFVDNPEGLVTLGLFYDAKEKYTALNNAQSQGIQTLAASENMGCVLTAVSAFVGITQACQIWRRIAAGASEETVIAALRLVGKRAATVIGVGIMIYQVRECLDFW